VKKWVTSGLERISTGKEKAITVRAPSREVIVEELGSLESSVDDEVVFYYYLL
jgi:hypothetical protein